MREPARLSAVAVSAVALGGAGPASACAICFGDPNSPLTKSVEMGVWFLLAVTLLVEVSFGIFFLVYLRRRAQSLQDASPRPVFRLAKKGV